MNKRHRLKYMLTGCVMMSVLDWGQVAGQSPRDDRTIPKAADTAALGLSHELRFNFSGADWRTVLRWLAGEAHLNLEWRELPEGEFNLITDRSYSVTESLDIVNMHLLARGFTLLRRDEVLVLMKLDKTFDTTLVPRVQLHELDSRGRFDFVKVSFSLDWMLAENAVKELSPMLSQHGTLVSLTKTNRIEAMDIVGNLREIRDLLSREESGNSQERLVTEFPLQHTSPTEIIGKLHQLLGVEKPVGRMSNGQMQILREQYVFKTEMAKRLGDKAPNMQESRTEVHLVANEQRNSIVANAPPDKIAVIKQAIQALDVPNVNQGAQLSQITTMKVYPLNGADAEAVADILKALVDIGELHPNSRFTEDSDKQILFAYASLKDHVTITSVMDQLAGSSRSFKVIPLKRLKAGYVAKAIQSLMGGEDTSASTQGRNRRQQSVNSWKGFKVEADLPNNRLFLLATDSEFAQVEELLIKVGERTRSAGNVRVVRGIPDSVEQTIQQLRQQWPSISENPLDIRITNPQKESNSFTPHENSGVPEGGVKKEKDVESDRRKTERTSSDRTVESTIDVEPRKPSYVAFNQATNQETGDSVPNEPSRRSFEAPTANDIFAQAPPVVIRKGVGDELIISSSDPVALDQLESLLSEFLPEGKPYADFHLNHASPIVVELKLRQVFGTDNTGVSLPIKFVPDEATKSIMVLGAGPSELREMQALIHFYDQPEKINPVTVRKPRFIHLEYADAMTMVSVIKDIYRDYLSANDRALAPSGGGRSATPVATGNSGLLSIGTSINTNTVVVSAPDYLTDEIAEMISGLDVPDASTVIRTVQLGSGASTFATIEQLARVLNPSSTSAGQVQAGQSFRGQSPQGRSNGNQAIPGSGPANLNSFNAAPSNQSAIGQNVRPQITPASRGQRGQISRGPVRGAPVRGGPVRGGPVRGGINP